MRSLALPRGLSVPDERALVVVRVVELVELLIYLYTYRKISYFQALGPIV